jgi:hypothetical protein
VTKILVKNIYRIEKKYEKGWPRSRAGRYHASETLLCQDETICPALEQGSIFD